MRRNIGLISCYGKKFFVTIKPNNKFLEEKQMVKSIEYQWIGELDLPKSCIKSALYTYDMIKM